MQSICKEGHAVIQTKTDLQRFLSLEKTAYLYGDRRDTFIAYLTNDSRVQIWRYQKRLRICEYRYNNRHKTPLHFLAFLLARRKKNHLGSRLGIEISENVFDEGLRIYHYGNIVVNGDSHIGKNCVLHGANCIGNAATDFTAPQLGDNIDIGVGASVIGNVTIADGTRIGAGAVVTRSVLEKIPPLLAYQPRRYIKPYRRTHDFHQSFSPYAAQADACMRTGQCMYRGHGRSSTRCFFPAISRKSTLDA